MELLKKVSGCKLKQVRIKMGSALYYYSALVVVYIKLKQLFELEGLFGRQQR